MRPINVSLRASSAFNENRGQSHQRNDGVTIDLEGTMNLIKVWDLPVRLFHWSLVFAFAIAFISGENELWVHDYAGYAVLGLVLFRIVWGFLGTQHARFSNFVYSPRDVLDYLTTLVKGKPQHYLGHNPAGGWMVIALLASLLIAGISGWQLDEAEDQQPAVTASASLESSDNHRGEISAQHAHQHGDSAWEAVHEISVHVCLLLVFVHVLGVIVSSYLHKEALVKAMITGYKKR